MTGLSALSARYRQYAQRPTGRGLEGPQWTRHGEQPDPPRPLLADGHGGHLANPNGGALRAERTPSVLTYTRTTVAVAVLVTTDMAPGSLTVIFTRYVPGRRTRVCRWRWTRRRDRSGRRSSCGRHPS